MRRQRNHVQGWIPLLSGLLCLTLAASSTAQPQDDTARAKELFGRAEILYSVGEFEKALALYKQAYKVKQLPAFLFNIGQCHRYLRNYKKAIFFYQRFVTRQPDSPYRAAAEGFIEQCRAMLKKKPPAAPRPAAAGPADEAPRPAPPSTIETRPPQAISQTPPSTGEERADSERTSGWVWTGLAAGGALIIGGVVTGIVANSKNQQYRESDTSPEKRDELKAAGKPLGILSVVMLGVGGVTGAISGIGYWYGARSRSATTVSIAPLEAGGILVLEGDF